MPTFDYEEDLAVICPTCEHKVSALFEPVTNSIEERQYSSEFEAISERAREKPRVESVVKVGRCTNCHKPIILMLVGKVSYEDTLNAKVKFIEDPDIRIVFPISSSAPAASEDMPENLKVIYNEARLVFEHSPRAAAALLRLTIEKLLMKHLDIKGKSLNDSIEKLSQRQGISSSVIEYLHTVRQFGNDAMHAGEIDLSENRDSALYLFEIINYIIYETITRDKKNKKIKGLIESSKSKRNRKKDSKSS